MAHTHTLKRWAWSGSKCIGVGVAKEAAIQRTIDLVGTNETFALGIIKPYLSRTPPPPIRRKRKTSAITSVGAEAVCVPASKNQNKGKSS
jgi:hypothetical protein